MFPTFVVDVMHEVELGTWRSLFIHLLRLLQSVDGSLINELDKRYMVFSFTTSRAPNVALLRNTKVQRGANFWTRYNSQIFNKLFRNEAACGS
jgi:hypothetical protein